LNFFNSDEFWVDASDIGHKEGRFLWSDGTEVEDALWYRVVDWNEPDDFSDGEESCVRFYTDWLTRNAVTHCQSFVKWQKKLFHASKQKKQFLKSYILQGN